jgi:hypothetical protein
MSCSRQCSFEVYALELERNRNWPAQYIEWQRCGTCGYKRNLGLARTPRDEHYLLGKIGGQVVTGKRCQCDVCRTVRMIGGG